MKICKTCNSQISDVEFNPKFSRCRVCQSAYNKSYYEKNKEKIALRHLAWRKSHSENLKDNRRRYRSSSLGKESHERYARTLKGSFVRYKQGARRRGFVFILTLEEFETFWQKPCSYCGDSIETIGLDRIDSSKGYELGNCTPCCTVCNKMKLNYDLEEWILKMELILKHLGR